MPSNAVLVPIDSEQSSIEFNAGDEAKEWWKTRWRDLPEPSSTGSNGKSESVASHANRRRGQPTNSSGDLSAGFPKLHYHQAVLTCTWYAKAMDRSIERKNKEVLYKVVRGR